MSDSTDDLDDLDDRDDDSSGSSGDDDTLGSDDREDDVADDGSDDSGDGDSGSPRTYTFQFDANGAVIAVFETRDGVSEAKSIDPDEVFTRQVDGSIVKTEPSDGGTETTTYADLNGDGVYERVSEVWTSADGMVVVIDDHDPSDDDGLDLSTRGYAFQFDPVSGKLLSLAEVEAGISSPESIDSDELYQQMADGTIVKTELDDSGTEVTTYADPDGDGIFQRISEAYVGVDGAPAPKLIFGGGAADDRVAVRGGDDSAGGAGADDFVIREASRLRIMDFDDSEGDQLVFDTGLGLTLAILQAAVTGLEAVGNDLVVHFGPSVSITLVGVAGSTSLGWDDVTVIS